MVAPPDVVVSVAPSTNAWTWLAMSLLASAMPTAMAPPWKPTCAATAAASAVAVIPEESRARITASPAVTPEPREPDT